MAFKALDVGSIPAILGECTVSAGAERWRVPAFVTVFCPAGRCELTVELAVAGRGRGGSAVPQRACVAGAAAATVGWSGCVLGGP